MPNDFLLLFKQGSADFLNENKIPLKRKIIASFDRISQMSVVDENRGHS